MKSSSLRLRPFEDPNARVAPYESLLDLFTLISFVLIFAAMIYAARSVSTSAASSSVTSHVAKEGSSEPVDLAPDTILLVIHRRGDDVEAVVTYGSLSLAQRSIVTADNIRSFLTGLGPQLEDAAMIDVGLVGSDDAVARVFLQATIWFAEHGKQYRISYLPE